MLLNSIDKIGDKNPQLLREIKGRLKPRNITIAVVTSFLAQLLNFSYFFGKLPEEQRFDYESIRSLSPYCTGRVEYSWNRFCTRNDAGEIVINWQQWWLDQFIWLGIITVFGLIVVGIYMLVNDLAQEERRGTLNFIRLSPQSTQSILIGKLLGVPILVYLAAFLTIPLQLLTGLSAQVPLIGILSFWGVIAVSCLFFYSAALLFGLVTSSWGGFQAWLASGLMFIFLVIASFKNIETDVRDWLNLFSPSLVISYLVAGMEGKLGDPFNLTKLANLLWFGIPIGQSMAIGLAFAIANYALWTFGIWQALQRLYPNPSKTMLSKRQSYLLTASFAVVSLGFAVGVKQNLASDFGNWEYKVSLNWIVFFNFLLFLFLIAALSPQRQALYDWARYRREKVGNRQRLLSSSLIRDLIWGEKSPATVAIALNLVIISLPILTWILFWPEETKRLYISLNVILAVNATLFLASLAQLILFLKIRQQTVWAIGSMSVAIFVPPLIYWVLQAGFGYGKAPNWLWLFSAFPWAANEYLGMKTVFLAMLGQLSAIAFLNFQLTRKIRIAGESATKALLAERRSFSGN